MNTERKLRIRKNLVNYIVFLLIMGLTFYTVLHGQDWDQIWKALKGLSLPCLILILVAALFFVCAEGGMIWYLLRMINPDSLYRRTAGAALLYEERWKCAFGQLSCSDDGCAAL